MNKKVYFLSLMFSLFSHFLFAQAGVIDSTFGTDGILFIPNINVAADLIDLDDESAIILGIAAQTDTAHAKYYRIDYDGVLDMNFGQNGHVTSPDSLNYLCYSIESYDNDRFVSFGANTFEDVDSYYTGWIFRYFNNGVIDTSFGEDGLASFKIEDDLNTAAGLHVLEDKKILISYNNYQESIVLRRFLPDGSIDYEFGDFGEAKIEKPTVFKSFMAPLIQIRDNRIIIMGGIDEFDDINDGVGVLKLHMDGSIDTNFGTDGWVHVPIKGWNEVSLNFCQILDDGRMHFSGTLIDSTNSDNTLIVTVQLNTNGSLDASYGDNGISILPFPFSGQNIIYTSLIQPDGKVVIAGTLFGNSRHLMGRLNSNGTLDHSFGTNGFNYWFSEDYDEGSIVNVGWMSDNSIWGLGTTNDDITDVVNGTVTKYKSGLMTGTVPVDNRLIPMKVFPNPVSDIMQVQFELDQAGEVDFNLMSLSGKKVAHLDKSWFAQGHHNASYNLPADLASGNYLLTLRIGGRVSSFVVTVE